MLFLLALEQIDDKSERDILAQIYSENKRFVSKIIVCRYSILARDLDDVISEIFMRVIIHRAKFIKSDESEIKRLLLLYTKSVCIDWIRKKNNHSNINLKNNTDESYVYHNNEEDDLLFEQLWQSEKVSKIKEIVSKLSTTERNIISYKYIYDYSYKEIAGIMNITVTNVGTTLNRILKKINEEMEDIYGNE